MSPLELLLLIGTPEPEAKRQGVSEPVWETQGRREELRFRFNRRPTPKGDNP
jgi:hypothetical protein